MWYQKAGETGTPGSTNCECNLDAEPREGACAASGNNPSGYYHQSGHTLYYELIKQKTPPLFAEMGLLFLPNIIRLKATLSDQHNPPKIPDQQRPAQL